MRSIGFITKRAHKKSRLGCTECKRRKQKCDEAQPECGLCRRRNVSCHYLPKTAPRSVGRAAAHPIALEEVESFNNRSASTGSSSPDSLYDELHILDLSISESTSLPSSPSEDIPRTSLSLVHKRDSFPLSIPDSVTPMPWQNDFERQLYTFVCNIHQQSMVKPGMDNATREIWLEVVPKMAVSTEGVLFQLMLSLGSLLVATQSSDYPCLQPGTRAARLWKLSSSYFGEAVSSFRNSIVSGQMYDTNPAVFQVTALVLSYRTSLYANHYHKSVESLYNDTLGWFSATLGYIDLGGFFISKLRDTQLGLILKANPETTYNLFPFLEYIALQKLSYFDYLHPKSKFTYYLTGDPDLEDLTVEALHAYMMSIKLVGWVYEAALANKLRSEIFTMYHIVPFSIPKHFLVLLQQRRPRAIAILAHHTALLAFLGVYEHLHFWPREHILLLKQIIPPNWNWALDSALDIVDQAEERQSGSTRSRGSMNSISLVQPVSLD